MVTRIQGLNTDGELLRDVYVEHDPVNLDATHDGVCRQEFADDCNINILLERYEKTGVLHHYTRHEPLYLDLSDQPLGDLQGMLKTLDLAQEAFMTLPAIVRREFDQDPVKFMEFAADQGNLERMREWGLAPPAPVAQAPIEVRVVDPAAPAGSASSSS